MFWETHLLNSLHIWGHLHDSEMYKMDTENMCIYICNNLVVVF